MNHAKTNNPQSIQRDSYMNTSAEIKAVNDRMETLETLVKDNTSVTEKAAAKTDEMFVIFESVKGGFKVLSWFGVLAKWVAAIAAAYAAIWALIHNVKPPP